jgi:hypothetical protein
MGVTTGDQDRGRVRDAALGNERRHESRVEHPEPARRRQLRREVGGGGNVGRDDERVEGLEVQGVRDVDDDLAREIVGVTGRSSLSRSLIEFGQ